MDDKTKKTLGYIGKTAATIACPPGGGALWSKDPGKKVAGAIVGGLFSAFFCLAVLVVPPEKTIYDKPLIHSGRHSKSISRNVLEAFFSPTLFYFDSYVGTRLADNNTIYKVHGNDVVTFNNGEYNLNFPYDRKFGPYSGTSVEKARNRVVGLENALSAYLKKGDLFGARVLKTRLDLAKSNLEQVTNEYDETKQVFQDAVDKMNSELERLTAF